MNHLSLSLCCKPAIFKKCAIQSSKGTLCMHDIVQAESFRWSHLDLCFFRNQDTQQHFTQRRYIGFIQACLWLEGNIAAANLPTCIDFEWTKSSNSVQCWIMSNRHTQKHTHTQPFLLSICSAVLILTRYHWSLNLGSKGSTKTSLFFLRLDTCCSAHVT